jgi:hypothetical protein
MSSSVITQQSTGLATETQPGLVGTGAQTFAGNKTFTGNLGIGTQTPSSYGHGGNNKVVEILNPTTTINSQSHYMISSGFNTTGASALGTVSWALPNVTASEKLSAYVGATTETGHTLATPATAITFATRNSAGAPAERVRIDSGGNLLVGTNVASNSHVLTKATSVTLPSGTNNTSVHFTNRNAGASSAVTGWLAASFGSRDNASTAVVIGNSDGRGYIGGHNADLTAWSQFNIRGTSGIDMYSQAGAYQWKFGAENSTLTNTAFIVYNQGGVGVYVAHGATSWTANSDQRMKKNIKPLELGLEQIKALKPARFDYNNDESDNSTRVGFIAQEVLPVLPHAVTVPEESDKFMGVANTEMIPVLVKAIQELSAKNEELVARIAALEGVKS